MSRDRLRHGREQTTQWLGAGASLPCSTRALDGLRELSHPGSGNAEPSSRASRDCKANCVKPRSACSTTEAPWPGSGPNPKNTA
eukprot:832429-Pyramimonas_sp.AAC.1